MAPKRDVNSTKRLVLGNKIQTVLTMRLLVENEKTLLAVLSSFIMIVTLILCNNFEIECDIKMICFVPKM